MSKDKEAEVVEKLPHDIDLEKLMYHSSVKKDIMDGIRELEKGKGITHEQFKKDLEAWKK